MNQSQEANAQINKILQKMFIYADNKDLNINRIRNLIVNPQILRVLLHQLVNMNNQQKIQVMGRVANIYKKNSLNSCILLKRDKQIMEFNHSIFDQIVTFLFSIKLEFQDNAALFQTVRPLISGYLIGSRNIKNIINKIAKNFHFQNFSIQKLQLSLLLLKQIYKSQTIITTYPKCFFYMYGPNSGIRMIGQDLKWTLNKGMYFYINFCMESYQHEEMNLLNIHINDDSFQLSINEENYLTVKVFSASKVAKLKKIEQKKWYFLKLAYFLKTGIIRNSYQLVAYVQGQPYELRDLPIPSPTIKDSIDELIIGHEFYGKINVTAISRSQIHYWPKNGINSWSQIQGLLAGNKQALKDIFLFYSPLIRSKMNQNQIIYEITSKNHAQILDNTATHNNPFDQMDINYYGGLYTLIPFLYILRFYKYGAYETALQQTLDLFVLIFKSGYQNIENQAINCQFFGILAQFINQIDQRYITISAIQKIAMFKDIIQLKQLRKQYLQNLLLKIRVDRLNNLKVIQNIHKLISSFYYKDFTSSVQISSLYQIIWYVIDNFEPQKKQQCCMLHCWQQSQDGIDDIKIQQIEQHYKIKCQYIKQLIRYIIKTLCSTRRYDLLLQKNIQTIQQISFTSNKRNQNFSIFEFLKFQGYSICLKKMLLQCIQVGVEQDPKTLIKDTQLLQCMFGLLQKSELRDQITPVVSILNQCSKVLSITKDARNLQIIKQIGKQLDKMYMKKYAQVRMRSKSEGISIKKTFSDRKMSNQMEDSKSHSTQAVDDHKQKQKDIKNKIIKLKKQKQVKVSNDKQLYDLLINICCTRQPQSGDIILIDDDCTKIITPYFRLCCSKYKVKLIEIIRTTVLVRSKIENIPPKMDSLAKFDQIYRFILSEFILKELDPDHPNQKPTQESIYVIKNFFFILDNMVIGMKNNWDSMYLFILRMIGLLAQAKKDIHKKTQRSKQDILMASKVCVRKFVLRVLKYAQKSIQNMGNMVFLIYLVIFNNPESVGKQQNRLFDYFQSLQQNFFIGPVSIKNQDDIQIISKNIYVDQRIIILYLDGFKMDEVFNKDQADAAKRRKYITILIKAYFQLDESNQLQDYLFKLRKVFLSKSQFKDINSEDNKGIRSMISNYFINSSEDKNKQSHQTYDLYVAEIIGLLLCLTVQSSINTDRFQILKQSLQKYSLFIKAFALACSRDCLKKKQHQFRNQKLPTKIVYHLIHFLYEMMEINCNQQCKVQVQETIYDILHFLTILMSVLSQKVGNPGNLDDTLMLSSVMQDVQQYNFFSFKILQGVITLNQIRMFPTLAKQKCLQYLNHENMKKHFKIPPKVFLEKHIKQAVQIHKHNIEKIQKQLQEKFQQSNLSRSIKLNIITLNQQNQFEQYRLDHARKLNFEYRHMMKVWRKVWKRLRLYHYYWSVSMDQRQEMKVEWEKFKTIPYKHKFGKYTDLQGLRPILQVQPNEPWHVRKAKIQQQLEYRAKNFMVNLYKSKTQKNVKTKSFIDRFLRKSIAADYQFSVQWIKHNSKRKGRVSLTKQKIIFQYDSTFQKDSHVDFTSFTLAQHRPTQKSWNLVTISNILKRRYLMRFECLLIQFQDSSSIIFDFLNNDSSEFLQKISEIQSQKSQMYNFMKANKISFYLKNFKRTNYDQQIQKSTEEWSQGNITNLQYLMFLNKYSGRSYLDPVNYPVLPWILNNYQFKQFTYRDLSKTLGALGSQTRRQFYEHKVDAVDPFNNVPPYQYGTHYSSPGVLFNFLIRISPYTQAARTLQGGKFDLSDRLFSSIKVCWHSVRNQVSDVRELNPQFYYLPQVFINIDNYDFGLTQLKQRIDNVKLPQWASNAYQFVYHHRRAFECDQISSNINNWIDLIFGYKQKGKIARDNLNLYYYLTYQDSIDLNKVEDQVAKTSIQAQIIHFGQTPSQIFTKPHPQRKFMKNLKSFSEPQKIKFLGLIESAAPILLLGQIDNNLIIFNDSTLITVTTLPGFQIKSQISLLRNTSKQRLYFVQDISVNNKIVLFGNNRFIAVSSYVNGDLVIYNINGKKIHQKKGPAKCLIYVNKKQNLLLCGCKNGLLQVYEIVYAQKDSVNLIKIISQYYMYPIQHISQGAGFFSISSGNLVIINKITRGMNYVYDKIKMQGTKMIRSFQSKRKVFGSFICTNPLYCVVIFNSLQVYIYSINGQFLKLRQVENIVTPVVMIDYMQRENILVLQPTGLFVLKVPELDTVCSIPVPNKEYVDMKMIKDKLYLITNNGEILNFFNQKEVIFY